MGESICEQVSQDRCPLDLLWPFVTEHSQVVILLMPLTNDRGIDEYLAQIKPHVEGRIGVDSPTPP